VTLEEYRIQVIEKLKVCGSAASARSLLAEVDLLLTNSRISDRGLRTFWEALNNDLDMVAQDSTVLLNNKAATELSAVIAAARAAIFEYEVLIGSDEPRSGS